MPTARLRRRIAAAFYVWHDEKDLFVVWTIPVMPSIVAAIR